jgi:hypothetical protein
MKLIGLSIFSGFLMLIILSLILNISGSKDSGIVATIMWSIGFFSPGLYVLNKLYIKSKL